MIPRNEWNGRGPRAAERNAGTFVALGVVLFLAGGLIVLMAIVIPAMLALALLPLGFLFLAAFQYLVWGWWMPATTPDGEAEEHTPGGPARDRRADGSE
ncbi:MAG: hypothetical protein WD069_22035 [Planctomycetales bacterium]